jgi:hypothetical protein
MQNPAYFTRRFSAPGTRENRIAAGPDMTVLNCTGTLEPEPASGSLRPEIVFENWDKDTFDGWTVEGTAFGSGPIARDVIEKRLGKLGGESTRVVNSFFPTLSDAATGKLTSRPFAISRRFIIIWLGGGNVLGQTGANLVVDGKVMQTLTGNHADSMIACFFDTRKLEGQQATIEIFDNTSAFWGQVGAGRITFSDSLPPGGPDHDNDEGSLALALLGAPAEVAIAQGNVGLDGTPNTEASVPLGQDLIGTLGRTVTLAPGEAAEVAFVLAWHFPKLYLNRLGTVGRYYTKRFDTAQAVASYVGSNFKSLAGATRLWRDTWYDSTLPYWFLDRIFVNAATLATSGCYRFADGRFYAWEGGPGCCPGTCTHVWQYAHSMARLFPELERDTRERVDLGISLNPETGVSGFRGEFDKSLAVDGQAGTLLRIYREHQMAPDDTFLRRNWDKIKLMYNPLFALDADEDGILEGSQMNTLDRPWFGQIAWMSSMYVAALQAGEQMANEMQDDAFAKRSRKIAEAGTANITGRLFNGEYFFNIVDPAKAATVNSGEGSHIDQVYGQSWAFQLGLPQRTLPEKETRTALASLWKYNFSPNAGAYFKEHSPPGRQFVWPGTAGMIMCTFPRSDWDYRRASGNSRAFAYYFIETWTGQEYQVAAHMLWEGMLLEPMAIVRAIHDRYHPLQRDPYSELECGGHYSRAMASHGTFVGICGYEYHGPKGHLGFAPKLTPENFRAPFTAAEGWGTFAQTISGKQLSASLLLKRGQLKLQTFHLVLDGVGATPAVTATLSGKSVPATCTAEGSRVKVAFPGGVTIPESGKLSLQIV